MSNRLLSCGGVLRVVILRAPSQGAQRALVLTRFVGSGGPGRGSGERRSCLRGCCEILSSRQNPCVRAERTKVARARKAVNPAAAHARAKPDKSHMSPERLLLSGTHRSGIRCGGCHGTMCSGSGPTWMPRVGARSGRSSSGRRRPWQRGGTRVDFRRRHPGAGRHLQPRGQAAGPCDRRPRHGGHVPPERLRPPAPGGRPRARGAAGGAVPRRRAESIGPVSLETVRLRLEALAHPVRPRLVRTLARGPRTTGEPAHAWELSPPEVSRPWLSCAARACSRPRGRAATFVTPSVCPT